jgi:hypothetical protein
MKVPAQTARKVGGAMCVGTLLAIIVPAAAAATDGSLLSRASKQAAAQEAGNPRQLTDDGTLLTRASQEEAVRELGNMNPGRVTDGLLLSRAGLLYELAQVDPGYGTGESIVSETAAARDAAHATTGGSGGFDWGDAAAGFGLAAFAAALLAGTVFTNRRRGTLIHLP